MTSNENETNNSTQTDLSERLAAKRAEAKKLAEQLESLNREIAELEAQLRAQKSAESKPQPVQPPVVMHQEPPKAAPATRSHSRFNSPKKKWMSCLRCGRRLYTDIYHRLCRRCTIRNAEVGYRTGRISGELASLIRHSGFDDSW